MIEPFTPDDLRSWEKLLQVAKHTMIFRIAEPRFCPREGTMPAHAEFLWIACSAYQAGWDAALKANPPRNPPIEPHQ
jgi:hypothetical protein